MMVDEDKRILPRHEQQTLCTTRSPYRQGRRLTAVKVYSITKESNHLLIFGVPSLKLRHEAKALFIKFGKLLKFNITEHPAEPFTETYHAQYDRIQSARVAKRMLDTKNFYGGVLHVCYAPELESVTETRQKLIQRQRDVVFRLRNLEKEVVVPKEPVINQETAEPSLKLNMGNVNTIVMGDSVAKETKVKKRKIVDKPEFKPCYIQDELIYNPINDNSGQTNEQSQQKSDTSTSRSKSESKPSSDVEVVDCTSVDAAVVTNINEHLNYNKFGNEIIRKVPKNPTIKYTSS